eukprot:14720_1
MTKLSINIQRTGFALIVLFICGSIRGAIRIHDSASAQYKDKPDDITQILKPLSFIHIPKTGGTTIEQIAKDDQRYQWGAKYWNEHKQKDQLMRAICEDHESKCCCKRTHHMPPMYMYDISKQYPQIDLSYYDLNSKSLFTVVRNPFGRLISEYWWNQQHDNYTRVCNVKIFNKWLKFRLKKHKNIKDKTVYSLFQNECKSGCHFIPQWRYTHFINGSALVPNENILHTETLDVDFNSLMKRYNMQLHLEPRDRKNKQKATCDLLKPSVIDDEAMELVINAYRKDFVLFGYDINVNN